jgi:hypothetical protein
LLGLHVAGGDDLKRHVDSARFHRANLRWPARSNFSLMLSMRQARDPAF